MLYHINGVNLFISVKIYIQMEYFRWLSAVFAIKYVSENICFKLVILHFLSATIIIQINSNFSYLTVY